MRKLLTEWELRPRDDNVETVKTTINRNTLFCWCDGDAWMLWKHELNSLENRGSRGTICCILLRLLWKAHAWNYEFLQEFLHTHIFGQIRSKKSRLLPNGRMSGDLTFRNRWWVMILFCQCSISFWRMNIKMKSENKVMASFLWTKSLSQIHSFPKYIIISSYFLQKGVNSCFWFFLFLLYFFYTQQWW